jgi:hypothetical protein
LEPLQGSKTIVFSIVLDRRRPKSPKSRNREGWVLELGIAPPSGKPSGETRRQTTLIRALSDREQAASPPAPEHGRAVRGPPRGSARAPGSGNHARWPPWRTRSGAPAPCGWPGLSIPASSAPIPPPCAELRAGWPAPPQESTIPGLFKNVWNSGEIARLFRSRFGKKEIDKVPGAPFSDKRGPCTICYLLFRSR